MKRWDVFICHASEDKETLVRPLAVELGRRGLRVWLDEHCLTIGDSLLAKIEEGLQDSQYGIVILSPAFFAVGKDWPKRELDGLMALETDARKVILTVWHDISKAQVAARSPILAGRVATHSSQGLPHVITEVLRAIAASEPLAATLGIDLQRIWDLAKVRDNSLYLGQYQSVNARVIEGLTALRLSKQTKECVVDALSRGHPEGIQHLRLVVRDELDFQYGMATCNAFEAGYLLALAAGFCSLLAATGRDGHEVSKHGPAVTKVIRDLEATLRGTITDLFPDLAQVYVPRWHALLSTPSVDSDTYSRIEIEGYRVVNDFRERQGLLRASN